MQTSILSHTHSVGIIARIEPVTCIGWIFVKILDDLDIYYYII